MMKTSRVIVPAAMVLIVLVLLSITGCKGRKSSDNNAASLAGISVSTREIAIGSVVLDTPADQPITLRNTGFGILSIGAIGQTDPLEPPFSIVNDGCSGRSLAAGGACTLQVRFVPTSEGSFTDTFDIPSNAFFGTGGSVHVSGSGKTYRVIINDVKTDACGANNEPVLLISVINRYNRRVSGLGPADFQVSENGAARDVTSVSENLSSAPLSVTEVLDYSTSLNDQLSTMEDAAGYFITFLAAGDEAAIIKFAESSQLMQDFTDSQDLLKTAALAFPTTIGSREETHLYDSLWDAIDTTAARQNNRIIILISDGKDEDADFVPNTSVKSLSEVISHAVEKNTAIFAVGLGNSNGTVMNQLASGTGGQYFFAQSAEQLYGVFDAIRACVSGQYSLKYSSLLHGGGPVVFTVGVNSNGRGEVSRRAAACP